MLRSRQILKALKGVCLEDKKEKLYLANSKDLVQLIMELQLAEFWPSLRFDRGAASTGRSLPLL